MKAALLLIAALAAPAYPAGLQLPPDGWASWQVPAVDGAPAWCCTGKCRLDGDRDGFSIHDGDTTTDAVKLYARMKGGKVDSLQVYAASCPVEAKTPIEDLGSKAPEDSVRWLAGHVTPGGTDAVVHRSLAESALAALALHRGEVARDSLMSFARKDPRGDTRRWAIFWLAMVRGAEQGSEQVIREALGSDPDADVREHAVFALSRLPGERSTKALIAVAEDRSLPRELRKRAVFWLSQSESDSAQGYLERILARTPPH